MSYLHPPLWLCDIKITYALVVNVTELFADVRNIMLFKQLLLTIQEKKVLWFIQLDSCWASTYLSKWHCMKEYRSSSPICTTAVVQVMLNCLLWSICSNVLSSLHVNYSCILRLICTSLLQGVGMGPVKSSYWRHVLICPLFWNTRYKACQVMKDSNTELWILTFGFLTSYSLIDQHPSVT